MHTGRITQHRKQRVKVIFLSHSFKGVNLSRNVMLQNVSVNQS